MSKQLSIVMPVFNKINFTMSALSDLLSLENDMEILVIDNASSDDTKGKVLSIQDERIKYIRNETNLFHSEACNMGFNQSIGEYVLFLNNDIRVRSNHAHWVDVMIQACDHSKGLVGPTMGLLDKYLNFVKEDNKQLEGNSYLGGWCIIARRDVWEQLKVKGTDQVWSQKFPFYFNDTDLSFRARRLNIPLTCVSLSDIVHFGKISAAQINIPKLYNEGRAVFLKNWK